MAKVKRDIIAFKCSECGERNYTQFKTKNVKEKIEKRKYCPVCKKHTVHKETKIK
ncbi:MAG TPA: 50S ribosomal protein L33 [Candidatus Dojkabacteria bacterium]|nr:50S ribosomal protein L33 [Candidatus Dojkabacteria bacterium]